MTIGIDFAIGMILTYLLYPLLMILIHEGGHAIIGKLVGAQVRLGWQPRLTILPSISFYTDLTFQRAATLSENSWLTLGGVLAQLFITLVLLIIFGSSNWYPIIIAYIPHIFRNLLTIEDYSDGYHLLTQAKALWKQEWIIHPLNCFFSFLFWFSAIVATAYLIIGVIPVLAEQQWTYAWWWIFPLSSTIWLIVKVMVQYRTM
ncbi:hypothetical protein HY230_10880 [Candidatus Acetothermia bacterium]|nr:hypothetical protein [Candidatus Acetothermia bacterium]